MFCAAHVIKIPNISWKKLKMQLYKTLDFHKVQYFRLAMVRKKRRIGLRRANLSTFTVFSNWKAEPLSVQLNLSYTKLG